MVGMSGAPLTPDPEEEEPKVRTVARPSAIYLYKYTGSRRCTKAGQEAARLHCGLVRKSDEFRADSGGTRFNYWLRYGE